MQVKFKIFQRIDKNTTTVLYNARQDDTLTAVREYCYQSIYRLLTSFDDVYAAATEAERKELMRAFIERIDLYPEKREEGCWIKNIVFSFPIPYKGGEPPELPLENCMMGETVSLMTRNVSAVK